MDAVSDGRQGVGAGLWTPCRDVFVYFKHEDAGKGAVFGQKMIDLLARG